MNHLGQTKIKERLPKEMADYRKSKCGECSCAVDFYDACSTCPKKHWGPFACSGQTQPFRQIVNFPSKTKMASNFLQSSFSEIAAILEGQEKIKESEKEERLSICQTCEMFEPSSKRCKKCGCYLEIKASWRSQHCPIGKW